MSIEIETLIDMLGRTPRALRTLLRGLPDEWVASRGERDDWSAYDVVAHLLDNDHTNWIPRLETILTHGDQKPFPPFDRYAHFESAAGRSLDELLDAFEVRRNVNLDFLEGLGLTTQDLERPGLHPEFGPVTLGQLLATWMVHDLNHLRQIAEGLAQRHADDVGPWRRYLGVLDPG